jgi:hypothetical protein
MMRTTRRKTRRTTVVVREARGVTVERERKKKRTFRRALERIFCPAFGDSSAGRTKDPIDVKFHIIDTQDCPV